MVLRAALLAGLAFCLLISSVPFAETAPTAPAAMELRAVDRSPIDLVLAKDGSWLVTANQSSGTASLVRTSDGQILAEVAVGEKPVGMALGSDGKTIYLTASYSGQLTVLEVAGEKLREKKRIRVGGEPIGIALTKDGGTAYVACSAFHEVAVVDLEKGVVAERIPVGRWPRHLCLTPDGKRLAIGTSGDRGITILDTATRKEVFRDVFLGINIGQLELSEDGKYAYFPWMTYRTMGITPGNIRLGWVLASRLGRIRLDEPDRREAMSLDPPGKAVADPYGIGLTAEGKQVVVSSSGTHELLIYRREGIPFRQHGSTDHLPPELQRDRERFFRIETGGRPMGLRVAADSRTVYVANYLTNSVQVVDLAEQKVVKQFSLGSAEVMTPARAGETIFFDAGRSLDQWYSCHTCHPDGGTQAIPMDTDNDRSDRTYKTVLPLTHLSRTGPYTWHGWQKELPAAMKKSLTSTMKGPAPTDADVDALLAYLETLRLPPNPFRQADGSLTAAAERGQKIFNSDLGGCVNCHQGPQLTDGKIHQLGHEEPGDPDKGFNTPSLIGAYRKVVYFHDGRAASIEELLKGDHNPAKVQGARALTEEEMKDLVEFVKSQ